MDPEASAVPTHMHVFDADDWIVVYRNEQLVYSGHGGYSWTQAMALTGCVVEQLFLEGPNDAYQISNLLYEPPQNLAQMLKRVAAAGMSTEFIPARIPG